MARRGVLRGVRRRDPGRHSRTIDAPDRHAHRCGAVAGLGLHINLCVQETRTGWHPGAPRRHRLDHGDDCPVHRPGRRRHSGVSRGVRRPELVHPPHSTQHLQPGWCAIDHLRATRFVSFCLQPQHGPKHCGGGIDTDITRPAHRDHRFAGGHQGGSPADTGTPPWR